MNNEAESTTTDPSVSLQDRNLVTNWNDKGPISKLLESHYGSDATDTLFRRDADVSGVTKRAEIEQVISQEGSEMIKVAPTDSEDESNNDKTVNNETPRMFEVTNID